MSERGPDPQQLAGVRGELLELLSGLDRQPRSVRVEVGDVRLELEWHDGAPAPDSVPVAAVAPSAPAAPVAAEAGAEYLRAPTVGTFYLAKEPGAAPFVSVGDLVEPGQQIGIIEAMKLMMPVEADRSGRVTAVIKGDGEPVEFDEPLFAVAVAP